MSNFYKKVYGIDLGTTYSAIAFIDEHGKAQVIPTSEGNGEMLTPSVVYYESPKNVIVGKEAKRAAESDPNRCVSFVKGHMYDRDWSKTIDGTEYKPEEVSAAILRRIAEDASKSGEHKVEDVVITCPAYFGQLEIERTRNAGKMAGLNVRHIVPEPVAAAINYALNVADAKGQNIIVYDLGGGTFDVSVVQIGSDLNDTSIRVVCTEGSHNLGGKNWDQCILNYAASEFRKEHPGTAVESEPPLDSEFAVMHQSRVEDVKQALSRMSKSPISVSFDGKTSRIELTREKFDKLTENQLEQTIGLTDDTIRVAKEHGVSKIDRWLLVGSSTIMPQVKERLIKEYGLTDNTDLFSFDVGQAVAKGAAKVGEIYAMKDTVVEDPDIRKITGGKELSELSASEKEAVISGISAARGVSIGEVRKGIGITLKMNSAKSYGIVVIKPGSEDEEKVNNLILKNSVTLPVSKSATYRTHLPNQTGVTLEVRQNDYSESDTGEVIGELLGSVTLDFEKAVPQGTPVEATLMLNDKGDKITVTGRDPATGKDVEATFDINPMSEVQLADAKKRLDAVTVS